MNTNGYIGKGDYGLDRGRGLIRCWVIMALHSYAEIDLSPDSLKCSVNSL